MADYHINVFLNDEQQKRLDEAGLGDEIKDIQGKKGIEVEMGPKEQKKLKKAFPDLEFDESNGCVLSEQAQNQLLDIIADAKTLNVMKVAISKLYNPLAGKELRSRTLG